MPLGRDERGAGCSVQTDVLLSALCRRPATGVLRLDERAAGNLGAVELLHAPGVESNVVLALSCSGTCCWRPWRRQPAAGDLRVDGSAPGDLGAVASAASPWGRMTAVPATLVRTDVLPATCVQATLLPAIDVWTELPPATSVYQTCCVPLGARRPWCWCLSRRRETAGDLRADEKVTAIFG